MKFYLKIYIYIPAKQPSSKSDEVRCVCILCCLKKEVEEKREQQRDGDWRERRENKKDPTLHAG
jgi:hypothetical protein